MYVFPDLLTLVLAQATFFPETTFLTCIRDERRKSPERESGYRNITFERQPLFFQGIFFPEDRIFNRFISDISVVLREATVTSSDSIDQ